jgi:peptidyl-prolyl cis-trans isomerase D
MEFLRTAAKTWVAKFLMALLVLSFSIWGVKDMSSSFLGDFLSWTGWGPKDLVHVAGRTIRQPEYQTALEQMRKSLSAQSGQNLTIDDLRRMGADRQVLDNIIAGAAIEAEGSKLKLAVSDVTIRESIFTNKYFQDSSGKFDAANFSRALAQNDLSESAYVAGERKGRIRSMVTSVADGAIKLPKTLSSALAQYAGETRDVKYFNFTVSEADLPAVTDAELKKQYEAVPASYTAPEYRAIAVMKVDPSDIADRLKVSDEELKAGYERYQSDYFTPEKRTILQVSFATLDAAKKAKTRIDGGEDMLKIATETGAKESDITLKDKQRGDFLDAKIGDAAFKLAQGAVSDPVAGDLATVLLKAVSIAPEKQSTLDEVKLALTSRLQLDKAKEEITAIYNAVEDARSQQVPMEKIAEDSSIPFKLIPAISAVGQDKTGKDVELPSKVDILKAAFASDVGNSEDALPIGDGYVWYEVREIVPPALKPLADVKADVTKDIAAAKMRDLASVKAKAFLADAKAGSTIEALATKTNGTVKTAAGLKRNETSQDFDGTAVVSLFNVGDQSFAWSLEGDGKTARIMQVSKITLPAVMASSPEISKLQDGSAAGLSRDITDTFVGALRSSASVSINEELWKLSAGTPVEQN